MIVFALILILIIKPRKLIYPTGFCIAFKSQPLADISSTIFKILKSLESNATTLTSGSHISFISLICLILKNFNFRLNTNANRKHSCFLKYLPVRYKPSCFYYFFRSLHIAIVTKGHQRGPCNSDQRPSPGTSHSWRHIYTAWPFWLSKVLLLSVFCITVHYNG